MPSEPPRGPAFLPPQGISVPPGPPAVQPWQAPTPWAASPPAAPQVLPTSARTPVDRQVRWRIIAPLLSLLVTATAVFGALIALVGGLSLVVPASGQGSTTGHGSTAQPSDEAIAATLRALLEAPVQVLGLAFGGHLHGISATAQAVISLDARIRTPSVLLVFALVCRALSRRGPARYGLPWRDALTGALISATSATMVLSLAALALGIDASTRVGGEPFTAFAPMLVVGCFLITLAVVFWALLASPGDPRLPASLSALRAALAVVWRLLWTFGVIALVAGVATGVVLAGRHGVREVLGVALMAPLALGNGVLAALDAGTGGRVDWQFSQPYLHTGSIDLLSLPLPISVALVVAALASALLASRRWRGVRADPGVRWWLLPLAFAAVGAACLWLVDATGAFDGGAIGGQVQATWWTPIGWAVLGALVDQLARVARPRPAPRHPHHPRRRSRSVG